MTEKTHEEMEAYFMDCEASEMVEHFEAVDAADVAAEEQAAAYELDHFGGYYSGYLVGYLNARKHKFTLAYWRGYFAGKMDS